MSKKLPPGLQRVGDLVPMLGISVPEDASELAEAVLIVSKRAGKRIVQIEAVKTARDQGKQDLGYHSRPLVLCGLPVTAPFER